MEKAVVLTATTPATGYVKENLLGYNLKRYYKLAAAGDIAITIDLGSAKRVDSVGFWVHNYLTDHASSDTPNFKVSYSSDNSNWTTWFDINLNLVLLGTTTTIPIGLYTGTVAKTYRYWKIEFVGMSTVIELSQIFLCRDYNLYTWGEWTHDDTPEFQNDTIEMPDGGTMSVGRANLGPIHFSRQLIFPLPAGFLNLRAAHTESKGSRYPIIYWEDDGTGPTGLETALVVKFVDDSLPEIQGPNGYYKPPPVKFRQVPYIQDGETF